MRSFLLLLCVLLGTHYISHNKYYTGSRKVHMRFPFVPNPLWVSNGSYDPHTEGDFYKKADKLVFWYNVQLTYLGE